LHANPAANFPADADTMMTDVGTLSTVQVEHRRFATLGKADHGWLKANHHFSFASYYDPSRMNWGAIRVWNDDEIGPKTGFPPHPHDNMEIITYVREGAITHRDSMGNLGRTEAGDVQVMSAGTGVTHSEYNLEDGLCRLFQIWILPRQRGVAPHWDQRQFPKADRSGRFTILASGYGDRGALSINADARVLGATVSAGETLHYDLADRHNAYLVAAKGRIRVNGVEADARDGIALHGEGAVAVEALEDSELVMVDSL
jgi:redox-sensitive bicupin YhaK (pirin superfamily)